MEEARFSFPPSPETLPAATLSFPAPDIDDTTTAASAPYVGRWNRLISTTNWEKGSIIAQWRNLLVEQELPAAQYSDEAWSRLVGGVTGQHAGRLRRVYQRFGGVNDQYEGLYWSHFQAALDWNDAEMWLEGAVQNQWSVNEMRRKRWETLGAVPEDKPQDKDIVAAETDEDYQADKDGGTMTARFDESHAGPLHEGPDFGDEDGSGSSAVTTAEAAVDPFLAPPAEIASVRPFENLPALPDDVQEAFESFKLAILHHKTSNWEKISRDDLIASLEALKLLALTPADSDSSNA